MHESVMKKWIASSHLDGGSMAYVEGLYESYLDDASSVPDEWAQLFGNLPAVNGHAVETKHSDVRAEFTELAKNKHREVVYLSGGPGVSDEQSTKQVKVLQLINSYRFRGHQNANLDPLGLWQREQISDLTLAHHSLSEEDFNTVFNVGSFAVGKEKMPLGELFAALKKTYSGSIGAEYMHITSTTEKRWIQHQLESVQSTPSFSKSEKQRIYRSISAADGIEKYVGTKFPGAKRFSLEGADSFISMMREIIHRSGEQKVEEIVVGMAHRGRLNLLVNILGKNPAELFDEFAGKHDPDFGSGDVKYHQGFSSDFATDGGNVHVALAFNPSHLEIVNPVVMGSLRARLDRRGCTDGSEALGISVHGDSAIAGQGVVQETFNLSQVDAFKVGGMIRIVINNQIGFTTSRQEDIRSTEYCTDIAKMVQAPIFHVNGDDPEAVALISRIAVDYCNTFRRDVVIDLVCYRRHGHNEADEPSATQPMMYQTIKKHPVTKLLYAKQLIAEGTFDQNEITSIDAKYRDLLDNGMCATPEWQKVTKHSGDWEPYIGHDWDVGYDGSVSVERLKALAKSVSSYPDNHELNSRVKKAYDDRKLMTQGDKAIDWGMAEMLAYADLVDRGDNIRFVGQDSGRGTFFHRHAVLHNQVDGSTYTPLQHISEGQGKFEIYDSALSEEAVLAFEYGYNTTEASTLGIWEAQFGDFANGAQVVIDQFISSGEQKWQRLCGLTMLLPHGYEGQGPEHSSARLERYLQLCANHNIQVCTPTTPAQVFNMLRRQAIRPLRRPLVVMTPKSLLRNPLAVSSFEELSEGIFHNMIDEIDDLDNAKIERVVFCGGKVYFDLLLERRKRGIENVALVRVEQLYPFPHEELDDCLENYKHVKDFAWCQEEPQNQGAWFSSQHHFRHPIHESSGAYLNYVGRPASAAPAVGYAAVHAKEQAALVDDALTIKSK
ncbi:MAG: 2-oxoglutarate dehydrogenase E1 component [Algicola sp.]|nr:2-oxoglutarate dehydrogenase E1 component [Algicola sp.]